MTPNPQEYFDVLHAFIKTGSTGTGDTLLYVHPFLMGKHSKHVSELGKKLRPVALKVMESGIYWEGGLKTSFTPYESHPIPDLTQFIYELSELLYMYEAFLKWRPEREEYYFSKGIEYLDTFSIGVRMFKGRRAAQRYETALRNLKDLVKEIMAKPDLPSKQSRSDLKQEVVDIFRKHIQAPHITLSERISELLTVFDISTTPEGIRNLFKKK